MCCEASLAVPQISVGLVYDLSGSSDLIVHDKIASYCYVKHTGSAAAWDAFSVLLSK